MRRQSIFAYHMQARGFVRSFTRGWKVWMLVKTHILADFGEFVPRDNITFNNSDSHG